MNTTREEYLLKKYLGDEAIKGLRMCSAIYYAHLLAHEEGEE